VPFKAHNLSTTGSTTVIKLYLSSTILHLTHSGAVYMGILVLSSPSITEDGKIQESMMMDQSTTSLFAWKSMVTSHTKVVRPSLS
jgi:hypothetical protein